MNTRQYLFIAMMSVYAVLILAACGGKEDTTAPTAPADLIATPVDSSRIDLAWTASTDDVGVAGYEIWRDSAKIADAATPSYSDSGLASGATCSYIVKAYDEAGNISAASNVASATTDSAGTDEPATSVIIEAESYTSSSFGGYGTAGQIRIEDKPNASNGKAVHIGPDSDVAGDGLGDALVYNVDIPSSMNNKSGKVEIQYSDDVSWNAVALYLDGARKGSVVTEDSGTWNDFISSCQKVDLGPLSQGTHTVELRLIKGGSYGVLVDKFTINGTEPVLNDDETAAYLFLKSLIDSNTGLVKSTECEQWTTVYKNALASMAFIHQGDLAVAEGIFDFFNAKYDAGAFQGFTKTWNAATGEAGNPEYWEGDNAFLLIALHYYSQVTGSSGSYQGMTDGLVAWLAESGNANDGSLIPEGLIDIFAALKPFETSLPADTPDVLLKLHSGFLRRADYANTGDHIERAALTLGDLSGLDQVSNFARTDTWQHDGQTQVQALSAFSSESFINTEISAQLLLAWKIQQASLNVDLSYLEPELGKMRVAGSRDPGAGGVPYVSRDPQYDQDLNPVWYDYPMIDTTAYLLFYHWGFNPMVPNAQSFDLDYDFQECEVITSQTGSGNVETHSDAVGDRTFQIGSDNNEVIYQIDLHRSYDNAVFHIRYSDDVAGNVISVYIDDVYKGAFTTSYSGGWETFVWNADVSLGALTAGAHSIKLVSAGGTYGVNLDVIKVMD